MITIPAFEPSNGINRLCCICGDYSGARDQIMNTPPVFAKNKQRIYEAKNRAYSGYLARNPDRHIAQANDFSERQYLVIRK